MNHVYKSCCNPRRRVLIARCPPPATRPKMVPGLVIRYQPNCPRIPWKMQATLALIRQSGVDLLLGTGLRRANRLHFKRSAPEDVLGISMRHRVELPASGAPISRKRAKSHPRSRPLPNHSLGGTLKWGRLRHGRPTRLSLGFPRLLIDDDRFVILG